MHSEKTLPNQNLTKLKAMYAIVVSSNLSHKLSLPTGERVQTMQGVQKVCASMGAVAAHFKDLGDKFDVTIIQIPGDALRTILNEIPADTSEVCIVVSDSYGLGKTSLCTVDQPIGDIVDMSHLKGALH